jgi:hypothetical protein
VSLPQMDLLFSKVPAAGSSSINESKVLAFFKRKLVSKFLNHGVLWDLRRYILAVLLRLLPLLGRTANGLIEWKLKW